MVSKLTRKGVPQSAARGCLYRVGILLSLQPVFKSDLPRAFSE